MKCPKCNSSGLNCSLCGGSGYVDVNQDAVKQYLDWKKGGGAGCIVALLCIASTCLTVAYGLSQLLA